MMAEIWVRTLAPSWRLCSTVQSQALETDLIWLKLDSAPMVSGSMAIGRIVQLSESNVLICKMDIMMAFILQGCCQAAKK